jgi:hypothetical protein
VDRLRRELAAAKVVGWRPTPYSRGYTAKNGARAWRAARRSCIGERSDDSKRRIMDQNRNRINGGFYNGRAKR